MKRKGFTLIELLAVIVILAIIALIATPIILSVIDKAKKGAAEVSALNYVDIIENSVMTSELKGTPISDGTYKTSDISVSMKGEPPTSGTYTIEKGIVKTGTFCINNYNIEYSNSKAKATGKCGEESKKQNVSLSLSNESGTISTSGSTSITATTDGTISCASSDESIATCSVSDKTITINGVKEGTTNITITSTSTGYSDTSKTYSVTVTAPSPVALSTSVQLGDYISMTPTSTSYTTDTSKTGYTRSQTINPSELNLWRVIKITEDGTIDVVSQYVSSVRIFFVGQTGYQYLVGYLNAIASQYTNENYVKDTRHMGYNGQTLSITDTSKLTSTTIPWTSATSNNSNESLGGGDILYTTDIDLVQNALGTLNASEPELTTSTSYWLGSRYYDYSRVVNWNFYGRDVVGDINNNCKLLYYLGDFYSNSCDYAVRPILTLKSDLTATGSGTSEDPYVLP